MNINPDLQLQDYRWEEGHIIPQLEIEMRSDGGVIWVNFNGVCVFRACNLPEGTAIELKGIKDIPARVDGTGYMWYDPKNKEFGSVVYTQQQPGMAKVIITLCEESNEESIGTPDSPLQG